MDSKETQIHYVIQHLHSNGQWLRFAPPPSGFTKDQLAEAYARCDYLNGLSDMLPQAEYRVRQVTTIEEDPPPRPSKTRQERTS